MLQRQSFPLLLPQGRLLAAPSWVSPGTLEQNCRFLAGKVQEVGLCFFEAAACLAYGPHDLPAGLACLPLRWHVHLPLDLDWSKPREAAEQCLRLMDKAAFLGAETAVLHPPPFAGEGAAALEGFLRALSSFAERWRLGGRNPEQLHLENLPEHVRPGRIELACMGLLKAVSAFSYSICFDFGHFLLHNAYDVTLADAFAAELLPLAGILHICAPAQAELSAARLGRAEKIGGAHSALPELSVEDSNRLAALMALARPEAVHMLELFTWETFLLSFPLLKKWLEATQGK